MFNSSVLLSTEVTVEMAEVIAVKRWHLPLHHLPDPAVLWWEAYARASFLVHPIFPFLTLALPALAPPAANPRASPGAAASWIVVNLALQWWPPPRTSSGALEAIKFGCFWIKH